MNGLLRLPKPEPGVGSLAVNRSPTGWMYQPLFPSGLVGVGPLSVMLGAWVSTWYVLEVAALVRQLVTASAYTVVWPSLRLGAELANGPAGSVAYLIAAPPVALLAFTVGVVTYQPFWPSGDPENVGAAGVTAPAHGSVGATTWTVMTVAWLSPSFPPVELLFVN